jgi:hypothetical protein
MISLIGDEIAGTRGRRVNFAVCESDGICVMLQGMKWWCLTSKEMEGDRPSLRS